MLLVDSEAPVQEQFEKGDIHDWKPWNQLWSRKDQAGNQCDLWDKVGANTDCHLMVQMMESWLLADASAVKAYFKAGFKEQKFPSDDERIEAISKTRVNEILASSTRDTVKAGYNKGRDSFVILGQIDPGKVVAKSKWAERFLRLLVEKMGSVQTF